MSQDSSVKILRKINEAKKELRGKNVQGCLLYFKAALEIAMAENILPADKKAVQAEIEGLQADIQNNVQFKQIFGPVTFSGSEFDVALAFVKQLIQASAEELFESTELSQPAELEPQRDNREKRIDSGEDKEALFSQAMGKINNGQLAEAREIIAEDEQILDRIIDALNDSGISARSSGRYDEALLCYNRGIELRPNEEGLHYNMARACFEKGDVPGAFIYLDAALRINPDFASARELLNFLKSKKNLKSEDVHARDSAAAEGAVGSNDKRNRLRSVLNFLRRSEKR